MQVLVRKMMLFLEWQEKQNVLEQEKSKQNFSRSRAGEIFPGLEQEKFCLLFSVWKWAKTCIFSDFFLFWNNEKKF